MRSRSEGGYCASSSAMRFASRSQAHSMLHPVRPQNFPSHVVHSLRSSSLQMRLQAGRNIGPGKGSDAFGRAITIEASWLPQVPLWNCFAVCVCVAPILAELETQSSEHLVSSNALDIEVLADVRNLRRLRSGIHSRFVRNNNTGVVTSVSD